MSPELFLAESVLALGAVVALGAVILKLLFGGGR